VKKDEDAKLQALAEQTGKTSTADAQERYAAHRKTPAGQAEMKKLNRAYERAQKRDKGGKS